MNNRAPSINFFYEKVRPGLKDTDILKKFLLLLCKKEGKKVLQLNYVFCTDAFLLRINRNYLSHDFYTDVLSFDLSEHPAALLGEIYISIDRVKQNAKTYKSPFMEELMRVIFHGCLHLCGYDDQSSFERTTMIKKENYYLDLFQRRMFHVK